MSQLMDKGCQEVTTAAATLNITGLQSNTKYDTYWIAVDVYGNQQAAVTAVLAQTNDNIPPNWIKANVTAVQGTNASLVMQLDEASTIYYTLQTGSVAATCPSPAEVRTLAPCAHSKSLKTDLGLMHCLGTFCSSRACSACCTPATDEHQYAYQADERSGLPARIAIRSRSTDACMIDTTRVQPGTVHANQYSNQNFAASKDAARKPKLCTAGTAFIFADKFRTRDVSPHDGRRCQETDPRLCAAAAADLCQPPGVPSLQQALPRHGLRAE
jgi:hypothetical protein